MNTIVLAFDIERSGSRTEHDTIGLGCCVVDSQLKELDSLFLPCYFPKQTIFEDRCWDEFWKNHTDKLEQLVYIGDKNKLERESECVIKFQEFRMKWEKYAVDNNCLFELVCDNSVFDAGFINQWIMDKTSDLPVPYCATKPQEYSSFWETHSIQRGIMAVIDPSFNKSWGFIDRLYELYDLPIMTKSHDHNPTNDAYTIAFEHQLFLGVKNGQYNMKAKTI